MMLLKIVMLICVEVVVAEEEEMDTLDDDWLIPDTVVLA